MYLTSTQPNIMAPGTGLVQHYNWSPAQEKRLRSAFGDKGMGCGCAGMAGCGCAGLGLFDSGLDVSGWGLPEFGIVALGGYMLMSTFFTTKRAARRVKSAVSGAYKGVRRGNPSRRRRARR
jgi:hypothetical protein